MSFASKHSRISEFPTYSVDYVGWKDVTADRAFRICWAGHYTGKYGVQPYVDLSPVENGEKVQRVRLPKYTLEEIEQIAADQEDMADIKAGKVGVKIHPYTTKNGNKTARIIWVDM